jgi:hypothetical protein
LDGRPAALSGSVEKVTSPHSQPQSCGIEGWTELRTRPDRGDLLSVQVYKTAQPTKVEAEGYTIIANVGDQISDLEGEHSGCTFKMPNPFYFIR